MIDLEVELHTEGFVHHELAVGVEPKITSYANSFIEEPRIASNVLDHTQVVIFERTSSVIIDVVEVDGVIEDTSLSRVATEIFGINFTEVIHKFSHVGSVVARGGVGWRVLAQHL